MGLRHMEHWWSFARVIDDIVVYVIVVDDIGNVSTTTLFSLYALLSWIKV